MKFALPALLVALLAWPAAADRGACGGEAVKQPDPEKLYWRLPLRLPGDATQGGYGAMPLDVISVKKWLCFSAISGSSRGQGVFWARSPKGTWIEFGGTGNCSKMSPWVSLNGRAMVLTGGRSGVQLGVFAPEAAADKRFETHDVVVGTNAQLGGMGLRQNYNICALDLAVQGGKLFAAVSMWGQSGGGGHRTVTASSGDGGRTWSKPVAVGETTGHFSRGMCLALWSDGARLHLVHRPPQASGGGSPKLKHQVSADEGKTWKDAAALPPPPGEKGAIQDLRTVRGGKDVRLLATDSSSDARIYLYGSANGGEKWFAPQVLGTAKISGKYASLRGCHLAIGARKMVFGYGTFVQKSNYRRVGGSRITYVVSGGLLVSRDDGKTWIAEDFTGGLTGKVYAPVPVIREDGGLDLVFGWTDGKGKLGMLYREALTSPPADENARLKERIAGFVKGLAADDYKDRERAANGLKRMGMLALPALRTAAKDKNPERSLTAEDLLRRMTPSWWKGP